jgi:hypothetical protein
MKWSNLLLNRCPGCNKDLVKAWRPESQMFICKCGFTISLVKLGEIAVELSGRRPRSDAYVERNINLL